MNIDSKKSGLESAARNARYKIFEEALQPNDQLLMAHHADDVAETILFRLFRGTGLDGLQGPMKKRTLGEGVILRPWLGYAKADLSNTYPLTNIEFITDDTNFEDIKIVTIFAMKFSRWLQVDGLMQVYKFNKQLN